MKIDPTQPQRILARFLVKEDADTDSPLHDKVYFYKCNSNVAIWNSLKNIQYGRSYDSDIIEPLNKMVKVLDKQTNGYIRKNWKDI